jgi:hypothetical protein
LHFASAFRPARSAAQFHARGQAAVGEELPEGVGGGREASRHAHAGGGQLADHLAEGGVLAAYRLDIRHPQVFERYDQGGRQLRRGHGKAP